MSTSTRAVAVVILLGALTLTVQGFESRKESLRPFALPSPIQPFRSEAAEGGKYRFWPRSAPVVKGVEYAFEVGHCGLEFLTDFDGSFWLPVEVSGTHKPYVYYGSDEGVGRIVLVNEDLAIYTTFEGSEIPLRRVRGPLDRVPCQ